MNNCLALKIEKIDVLHMYGEAYYFDHFPLFYTVLGLLFFLFLYSTPMSFEFSFIACYYVLHVYVNFVACICYR